MKRFVPVVGLLLVLGSPAFSAPEVPCLPAAIPPAGEILEVAQLMEFADFLQGPLRVDGLVKKAYPREGILGLSDATAFKKSGSATDCCVLPVRWKGPMPEAGTLVRLEGEIRKVDGKMEFFARSLEKVARP